MAIELVGHSNIPMIGDPITVHEGTASAQVAITCKCKPDNPPAVLRGVDVAVICQECGNVYQIVAVQYDIRRHQDGLPRIAVAKIGVATPPEDQSKDS